MKKENEYAICRKNALITGATVGIGRVISVKLTSEGARVVAAL